MMMRLFRLLLPLILMCCLFSLTSPAQETLLDPKIQEEKPLTRILFLLDASQSMYGRWQSDMKFNMARKILIKVLDSLKGKPDLEVALRVYGHQHAVPPQVCTDTRLEVPFGKDSYGKIKSRLNAITPKGTSPIAASLEQSARDFPPCDNCRNIIILITDGLEECGGDPCAVSQTLQKKGVILKPFIIGIGRNFSDAFNCVGNYFDASSEQQLDQALTVVISRALNPTSAQVNLLDIYGRPTETNVNMTFYDHVSKKVRYNFIHTMNSRGLPDTLVIDPLVTYDLVIHTLPPVKTDSVWLVPGKHNIIPVNTPQGDLKIRLAGTSNVLKDLEAIIRRKGSMETVNIQEVGNTERYITGAYDLEILSLPRIYINDAIIEQNKTTIIEIPVPGIAVIQKTTRGYGSLYIERGQQLEWVYNFRETNLNQESLVLMPGTYHAVYRSKYLNRSFFTVEKVFSVKSGITTNIKLYD